MLAWVCLGSDSDEYWYRNLLIFECSSRSRISMSCMTNTWRDACSVWVGYISYWARTWWQRYINTVIGYNTQIIMGVFINVFRKQKANTNMIPKRRSLVRFWPEVQPVFISLIMNVSFLLSNWLNMYKIRCIWQINKHYFHFLPYFIEISILAFWGFVWRKRCTILMEMNVDIINFEHSYNSYGMY